MIIGPLYPLPECRMQNQGAGTMAGLARKMFVFVNNWLERNALTTIARCWRGVEWTELLFDKH